MELRSLGRTGPTVSRLALGCMAMSDLYCGIQERKESIATIHAALDAGVTMLDTGDFYGMGHNELLISEALRGRVRDKLGISVKFGMQRGPDGSWFAPNGRPEAVKTALAYSLQRLGTDYIDIYRLARLDPTVPIEDTIGAIADMVQAGYVRHIGLSEAGVQTIRRAAAVHPISDVQMEYSLFARVAEDRILPVIRELGIGLTAYGVLARGLLSGHWRKQVLPADDFRSTVPWFFPENIAQNLKLVERLRCFANDRGASVAEVAQAWVAAQGKDIVTLVGATHPDQLAEALSGASLHLSEEESKSIKALIPSAEVAGARASGEQLDILDSEETTASG